MGFTLVEIAMVLVIITILAVVLGGASIGMVDARRRSETNQNLQTLETALGNFVATTRRLPCPADGSLPPTDTNFGLERRSASGTCDAMTTGVAPWRTLGLALQDATDGWQSLFTYRVPLHLTIDSGMSMADCDPAGTAAAFANGGAPKHLCVTTCTTLMPATCTSPTAFLTGKGFEIRNAAGTKVADPAAVAPTGAAYVLISAGPSLGPAYNGQGALVASTSTVGTEESKNSNNQILQAYYVDSDLNVSESTAHFDDVVRRPSISTVLSKANLGPRAH